MIDSTLRHLVTPDTPIGPVTIVADTAAAGPGGEAIVAIYLDTGVENQVGRRVSATEDPLLARAQDQLLRYFAGELISFDLPLEPRGTDFQRTVWAALLEIGYGETESYGELARRVGSPKGSRAVGLANGRNPISIVVPCHRVIGADGSLTGYGGGIERKRWLLSLERSQVAATDGLFSNRA